MSTKKIFKFLHRHLNYSILLIPNASSTKVKSCYIPCTVALIIIGFIIFNIYIFFGYSIQVWQINIFKRDTAFKQELIVKLTTEKKRIHPVLQKSNVIDKELSTLAEEQTRLEDTLTRVRQKKGRSIFIASRGFFVRSEP